MSPERPGDIPCVEGHPRPDGLSGLVVVCPHCGRHHYHGAVFGHRVGHCADGVPGRRLGYIIVSADTAPGVET